MNNATTTETKSFVAYYRVSTKQQGASGLGLDAQREMVRVHVKSAPIVAEFTEVESGKNNSRPQLAAAITEAQRTGSTLVIAKLDRLSRNAAFIFKLRDASVDFVCTDIPEANTLTIGIFAVLAQHERELISSRTRAALAQLKQRGVQLGTPANLDAAAIEKGRMVRMENARSNKANTQATELAHLYRQQGWSLDAIARKLNAGGYVTRNGAQFQRVTVKRLLDRVAA